MDKKIKILYLIKSFKIGGPVNMLYSLVKYIDKSKFDVKIVALKKCVNESRKNFEDAHYKVYELKNKKELSDIINKFNPDIIHSHGGSADYVCKKYSKRFITFSTIHCVPEEDFILKKGKIIGNIKAKLFYYNLNKIKFPIACSKTVSSHIYNNIQKKYTYVQNGIDLTEIKTVIKNSTSDKIRLIFCGYLSRRKNVKFLVEAIKKIKREDIELIILGDGECFEELVNLASDDSRIKFMGKVKNATRYLADADYFISASLSEGLPLAVMEGLALGLPAILSQIDSHQELKEIDDSAIRLFSLEKSDSLCDIINKLNKYNYSKESGHAYNIVNNRLNAQNMANEYEKLYLSKAILREI